MLLQNKVTFNIISFQQIDETRLFDMFDKLSIFYSIPMSLMYFNKIKECNTLSTTPRVKQIDKLRVIT